MGQMGNLSTGLGLTVVAALKLRGLLFYDEQRWEIGRTKSNNTTVIGMYSGEGKRTGKG